MSALRGFGVGVLALTALQAVVSSDLGTRRVTGALNGAAELVRRLADPTIPAIPDSRTRAASAAPPSTPSTPSTPAPSPRLPHII